MATIDIDIITSADDGDWFTAGFVNNGVTLRAGKQSTLSSAIYLRFQNALVNGTINDAYISVRSAVNQSNTVPLRIRAEDSANPAAPISIADANGRTRTTAFVDWTPGNWTSGTYYNSPSLASIIQELVDTYTYNGSQSIIIFIEDNGAADNTNRQIRSYDHSSTLSKATLHIDYTPGNTPPSITTVTPDEAVLTPNAVLEFSATDPENDDIRYQIKISDRIDYAGTGSLIADSFSASEAGIIHPNPTGTLTWQGMNQVDDRPGQSFTAMGGILDKIRVYFGADVDTDGYALVRVYDIQGVSGTNAEPLNPADPEDTPTPGWLAESDPYPLDSSAGTTVVAREFDFSGANRIRFEPGKDYMLIIDWIPSDQLYDNTIRIRVAGTTDDGNCYLDGAAPPNNGIWLTNDLVFDVFEEGILLDKVSGTDVGFLNTDNGGDTDPFTAGNTISYTVQSGDELLENAIYQWQVRAIDPSGSGLWTDWSTEQTFTVEEADFIYPDYIASNETFYSPTLTSQAEIGVSFLDATGAVYDVTLTSEAVVDPDFISPNEQVFSVTLTSAATVEIDFISSSEQVFNVTLSSVADITPDFIAATGQVYSVILDSGTQITPDFITATGQVYNVALTSDNTIEAGFISATSQVYNVVLTSETEIVPSFINSTAQVYSPSLTVVGADVIEPDFITGNTIIYAPSFDVFVNTGVTRVPLLAGIF